jgi:predicted ATPase
LESKERHPMSETPKAVAAVPEATTIRTPDQRLRVFVSSTLKELGPEREAVRDAVERLRLAPVMFELGARPHPPRDLYRAYLAQSHVFVGVYWESYGWVAPGEETSGLEDEYLLSDGLPRLIYVKTPAPEREPRLDEMLARVRDDDSASYKRFSTPGELRRLIEDDLALLMSEHFEAARLRESVSEESSPAGALPAPPTPLVGRGREAGTVGEMLLRSGVRLVTLTGPGGIGKSRLALEVGARLASSFEDGARFVALASVTDPRLVATTIAGALGLKESGGRAPVENLKAHLRNKRMLLVLDNFEQVADAAPLVAELLAAAPGVEALATSRTVLRLSGEHGFAVPPLSLPKWGAGMEVENLERYEAVRLFVERARAARPGFELNAENAPAVVEICRRLDGLPLAIELAAARVRLLPPRALLARLGSRLGLLNGGARDLPERQRTLRNTIAWSHGLLKEDERELFARLGVFSGGFGLQAAEAVGGAANGPAGGLSENAVPDVMEALGSLVDSSLVWQEERGGEPRFGMLETVREYALERLRETAGWREAHDRHAAHYLSLAEAAEAGLKGPGQPGWLGRLENEHDNLRAAMSRFLEQDRVEEALRLGWGMWQFWWLRGHVDEGARRFGEMANRSEGLPPYQRARALSGAGLMGFANGDRARAWTLLEDGLRLYRKVGDRPGIAVSAGGLGHFAALRGEYACAGKYLEESLALYRDLGDDWYAALMLNFLGEIPLRQGDHGGATRLLEEALRASSRAGSTPAHLLSLYNLALTRQARGDLEEAEDLLREGLSLAAGIGDEASVAHYLEGLADLAWLQDDPERAARLFGAAETLESAGGVWLYSYASDRSQHRRGRARSKREEAEFEAARAEGRAMGFERAVAHALGRSTVVPAFPGQR